MADMFPALSQASFNGRTYDRALRRDCSILHAQKRLVYGDASKGLFTYLKASLELAVVLLGSPCR
jgi:hypothetical protein